MNLGLVSLLALIAAIILGFIRQSNVGIISIGFAMLVGLFYGVSAKEVMSGFSSSLCIQMVGITYLFAIINGNGTLTILANKAVGLVGKRKQLIPFVMFIIGYVICAVGPGAIPSLAIIPVLAVPVAVSAGLNPIMVSLIGQMGVQAGRMSSLTPEAIVVKELMTAQGLDGNTNPLGICMLITELILVLIVYIYYKGWKISEPAGSAEQEAAKIGHVQLLSIGGLVVLVVGVLFFSWNVGLTGFLVGSLLIIAGAGEEKKAVNGVPWNVILMVLGVGILMNIITVSGGIDIMVAALEKVMGEKTAVAIMSVTAGVMSFFSSGLGVVFPTLIPTASGLAASTGAGAVELVAVVVVGGTVTGFSPISTAGALVMAAVSGEKGADEKYPQNKMFVELFGVAFIALAVLSVLSIIGVYGWVV